MKINVKFDINAEKIANRVIDKDVKTFANQTWRRLCDQFVPYKNSYLSKEVEVTDEYIWYKMPYAKKMYNGKYKDKNKGEKKFNFSKDEHHLATAEWDKVAFKSQGDKLKKDIENYIKRR